MEYYRSLSDTTQKSTLVEHCSSQSVSVLYCRWLQCFGGVAREYYGDPLYVGHVFSVYSCMCVNMYVYIYMRMYVRTYVWVYVCMYAFVYIYTNTYMSVCVYVCIGIYIHIYLFTFIYIYIYIYIR